MKILKIVISLVLISLLWSCTQNTTSDFNLGFEYFSNGKLQSWFINPKIDIQIDSIIKSEGKYSIILDSGEYILTEYFALDTNIETLIEVKLDYYFQGVTKHEMKIGLVSSGITDNKKWHYERDTFSLGLSNQWNTIIDTFRVTAGYPSYSLGFINYSNSSIWIDNIQITMNALDCKPYENISPDDLVQLRKNCQAIKIKEQSFEFLEYEVNNKRLVSLGESTHGTKEIFLIKNEIIKYLIKNQGFNKIIFEGNMGDFEVANEFLEKDPINGVDSAMTKVFKVYQTKEVKALFHWIQRYNMDKSMEQKIALMGCDIQKDQASFHKLKAYAQENDLILLKLLEAYKAESDVYQLLDIIKKIKNQLEEDKDSFPKGAFRYYYQHAHLLHQFVNYNANVGIRAINRDSCMANNIKWILDSNDKNKAIYWAHNRHVKKDNQVRYWPDQNYQKRNHRETTGGFLESLIGNDQYVIGFALNKGYVRAKVNGEFREDNILHRIMPYAYEFILSQLGKSMYFMDLSKDAIFSKMEQKDLIEIGAGMNGIYPENAKYNLAKSFDGVIYIDKSRAAEGLSNQ